MDPRFRGDGRKRNTLKEDPMPKVLISDALSETAVNIFRERGVDVDYQPTLGKDNS